MKKINLTNNTFDICPNRQVFVKCGNQIIGTCIRVVNKWMFQEFDGGRYRWHTLEEMQSTFENLEYYVEA